MNKVDNENTERRSFLKQATAFAFGIAVFSSNPKLLFAAENSDVKNGEKNKMDTHKISFFNGTCSVVLCRTFNKEFGYPKEAEERASNPLSGGLLQLGYECGMLWGASLAVGAEAFRTNKEWKLVVGKIVTTTKNLIDSLAKECKKTDCRSITGVDWQSKYGTAKFLLTGKYFACSNLMKKWAPEAFKTAQQGLICSLEDLPSSPLSCASEVARRMGANSEEMAMVAGFAGGLGLSGGACGALAAAIWIKTLTWWRSHSETAWYDGDYSSAKHLLQTFKDATGNKILCKELCGKQFRNLTEHTNFLLNGGCKNLIELVAKA